MVTSSTRTWSRHSSAPPNIGTDSDHDELRGRMSSEGLQLHQRGRSFSQPGGRTDSAARALVYRRTGCGGASLVSALVFLLHELSRQTGIDDLPGKYFVVTAPAAGMERGIDLRFAQRSI